MIRDLVYPEDARKELNSVLGGLAYDAAVAVAGVALSKVPPPQGGPDLTVPIRCGGLQQDQAAHQFWMIACDLQADQATRGVADQVKRFNIQEFS